jgi:hypothetical protein
MFKISYFTVSYKNQHNLLKHISNSNIAKIVKFTSKFINKFSRDDKGSFFPTGFPRIRFDLSMMRTKIMLCYLFLLFFLKQKIWILSKNMKLHHDNTDILVLVVYDVEV